MGKVYQIAIAIPIVIKLDFDSDRDSDRLMRTLTTYQVNVFQYVFALFSEAT